MTLRVGARTELPVGTILFLGSVCVVGYVAYLVRRRLMHGSRAIPASARALRVVLGFVIALATFILALWISSQYA